MDLISFVTFLTGCLAGVMSGILPGIGPPHLLAMIYIYLVGMDPLHLMIFYIGYLTVANFVDAIPSLYFGIPGEVSSVPASRESQTLNQLGLVGVAMKLAALGRLFGSLVALGLSFWIVNWLLDYPQIFSSRWQISFYLMTLICIMLAGENRWYVNLLLMFGGLVASAVGYNYYTEQTYLTLGWKDLQAGLPLMPVLVGLYVMPQILQMRHKITSQYSDANVHHSGNYFPSMLRGTGIGYILGLVPGMSYMLGSTAAYSLEKWWSKKWAGSRNPSVAAVVASETASNTGTSSVLIPLLLFGIPIIASEAIIYDLMIDSGVVFSLGGFLKQNYTSLAFWFVAACGVGLILSWPLANTCRGIAEKLLDPRFKWILLSVIMISLLVEAMDAQKIIMHLSVFIISLMIGWALRNRDVTPMIFVFVLGSSMQSVIYNLIQLYT